MRCNMIRSFKIRVYPTKEQERLMWKHVGASRWLYNFMLDEQKRRYENGEKYMSTFDMHKYITVLKKMSECEWNGIEFVQVGRFYPSSKTCSKCGSIKTDLKLSDRMYRCGCCGLVIDRGYNAAINLSRCVA